MPVVILVAVRVVDDSTYNDVLTRKLPGGVARACCLHLDRGRAEPVERRSVGGVLYNQVPSCNEAEGQPRNSAHPELIRIGVGDLGPAAWVQQGV